MPRIQIVINSNLILDYLPLFVAAAAVIDDALLYGMHCNCVEARVLRFFVLCVCCVSVFFFFVLFSSYCFPRAAAKYKKKFEK